MTDTTTPLPDDLAALADEPYVSFTTYRRTGVGVATPVWIARDGEALVFTTNVASGKAKRLRNNSDVELRACSRTGEVAEGAPIALARAVIVDDEAGVTAGIGAIMAKYGPAAERLIGSSTDRLGSSRVVIRITER